MLYSPYCIIRCHKNGCPYTTPTHDDHVPILFSRCLFKMNTACCIRLIDDHKSSIDGKSLESGGSGILINNRHVITCGSILLPLVSSDSKKISLSSLIAKNCHREDVFQQIKCQVLLNPQSETIFDRLSLKATEGALAVVQTVEAVSPSPNECRLVNGKIAFFWKNERFYKTLKRTFPRHARWTFNDGHNEKQSKPSSKEDIVDTVSPNDLEYLLSYFCLIRLDTSVGDLTTSAIVDSGSIAVGKAVSIQGA